MNIEFKYDKSDKKIIISNQNGVLTEMEYRDNANELLIQEDIIESITRDISGLESIEEIIMSNLSALESKRQDLEQKINEENKKRKSDKKIALILSSVITFSLTIPIYLSNEIQSLETLKSLIIPFAALFCTISVGYVFTRRTLNTDFDYKEGIKEKESLKKEVEEKNLQLGKVQKLKKASEKILERENEKYLELQKATTREKEEQMNNQITKVEYRERLEQIRNEIKEILGLEETLELNDIQGYALELTLEQKFDN